MSSGGECCGIRLLEDSPSMLAAVMALLEYFQLGGLIELVRHQIGGIPVIDLALRASVAGNWMPAWDTTALVKKLALDTLHESFDLEREVLITLLASPIPVAFPNVAELKSAIHIRRNVVTSARCTELNFDTEAAERPPSCWRYDEDVGFTVKPECSLVHALEMATQPELSGHLYSFSCYRATEYVILLGIAKELALCNPALLKQLQTQCEQRVIRSGQFHDVFLHEYGSQDAPLPTHYYVPGDRVWFRNPDERSSDIIGYEGSWVLYLGGGLFTNFWKHERPYTLETKCLEIFHWRHGAVANATGELQMDESVVERLVEASLQDTTEYGQIIDRMMRWRDSKGVYADGGCIDTTREGPRWVCPGSADLVMPLQ